VGLWRTGQANRSKSRWDEPPRWRLACVECVGVDRADYNPHAVFRLTQRALLLVGQGTYDARKALEAYSAKLRNETDLESLNNELVEVVRESMQPAHVSLWLHPDTTSEGAANHAS
jgi:hypothetical protein